MMDTGAERRTDTGRALRIAVILGTRPEIIKMSPVIRALGGSGSDYFILHTGQHYSYNMDRVFFESLRLPPPKYNLGVGSGTHAEETGHMLIGIEKILKAEMLDAVLVEGDTNSVLAGALAASKLGIKVGHVEAGLRSFDRTMPEEINRVLTDHISDYLFAPTEVAKSNALREGIDEAKIYVTGNTVVDAVSQNLKIANESGTRPPGMPEGHYILLTLHRQENVDSPQKLKCIMEGLALVSGKFGLPILYPAHPRTRKRFQEYGMAMPAEVQLMEPLDYLAFLKIEGGADLILTDSGGVQEEACILKVPCVTLRENTERPETVDCGANVLAGTDPESILSKASIMMGSDRKWINPFGDGKSAERIISILSHAISKN